MEVKAIKGHHHVSAITANARKNLDFYTKALGMRLVKKTVNQDDPSVYHLFYADEMGNPGTDFTFFEIPPAARTHFGTNSISLTSLRVKNDKALAYWEDRFTQLGVEHEGISVRTGRSTISFRDPEGQRLMLVSDEDNAGVPGGIPWRKGPVPADFGIMGLGPVQLTVSRGERTARVLTDILGYKETRAFPSPVDGQNDIRVFETGEGGTGSEIFLEERKDIPGERPGRGSVHHIALRVEDESDLRRWIDRINESGYVNSGFVDRYYFRSLYFRDPNGILFELATEGPGFALDEGLDSLGESLALPPHLESRRVEIEKSLKPLT
ncbi:ring-cleaving dioxygenase [Rossellomorea marisflavi]|uniref:Ring-cleaving dioxygenase n=1 Tax=Rossellomorea marisflavi TaxID=189381 RepID=A0A163LGA5_9BACI|nr:ring-cleaving dioxygenase [Rossellomorea marisflavi]KZE49961.1 ring-cleaving dioxygenase [Rossellomorea marisflavi]